MSLAVKGRRLLTMYFVGIDLTGTIFPDHVKIFPDSHFPDFDDHVCKLKELPWVQP